MINSMETAIFNSIMNNLGLPEGVTVVDTTPLETVEFVQVAADGKVSANCASGKVLFFNNQLMCI